MSAKLSGRAAFKKTDGVLAISNDELTVTWTPSSGASAPVVSLPVTTITNLQQTPDSNPKVMLKIFFKTSPGSDQSESYVFHFNTADGRAEANAIKDVIAKRINDLRTNDVAVPKPLAQDAATAGAGAGASAGAGTPVSGSAVWLDDTQLKADIELQHSLMKKDKILHQTYMATHQAKPASISDAAFNTQFWSTRTDLLRAHAVETGQKKGAYNVLSVVKPQVSENNESVKVNISVEQVQMILAQHPLINRLYNENVPRLSESDFWSKFFLSQLRKRLCGEKVQPDDKVVMPFDRADIFDQAALRMNRLLNLPSTIDIEANEENQGGFKGGNLKDPENRAKKSEAIMLILNSVSEKLMANVTPFDKDPALAEMDEDTIRALALRDLEGPQDEQRILLKLKEQREFFKQDSVPSEPTAAFDKQNPAQVLAKVVKNVESLALDSAGGINLHSAIGFAEESDSENEAPKKPHVGSRAALKAAQKNVMAGIAQRRDEMYGSSDDGQIPAEIMERCRLTNASTIEFLRQFWSAFLSGDSDRASDLQYVVEALQKSLERIDAVAEDAEKTREGIILHKKKEIRAHYEKTGKKIRWSSDMVGGGKSAVQAIFQSTLSAVNKAQTDYQRAYEAELALQANEG